jgi:hypothetical protein
VRRPGFDSQHCGKKRRKDGKKGERRKGTYAASYLGGWVRIT